MLKLSHFHIRPLVVILVCAGAAYGRDFSLIEEGELDFCTVEPSTPTTLLEEYREFIDTGIQLEFEDCLWKDIIQQKRDDTFEIPEAVTEDVDISTPSVTAPEFYPEARPELPYQARMSITGRKSISVKYGHFSYMGDEDERTAEGVPAGVPSGFEMDQELRVRIQGEVGDKITVNVDYDDTKPAYDEDARKISVKYRGDPDEIIQEAAFGDINLHIPATRFVGYSKNVFGASVRGQYRDLRFMAIGSQAKGTTEVQEFYGESSFQKTDIRDTSYIRRRYYRAAIDKAHLPLDPGTLRVYIDDRDPTTAVEKNKSTMTARIKGSTETYTGSFYRLVAGRDYYIDNSNGVINFRYNIASNYVIAVEYNYGLGTGEVGYSGLPVVIKNVDETVSTELKNRYSLGATRIMREDFVLRFLDLNRNEVELPEGSYRVDYDLGILEFTDDTPFYNPDHPEGEGYDRGGFKDIYRRTNPQHRYIIYVEYKRMLRNYFLRPNIIRGSERVMLDGRVLSRDTDYIIDYTSGFLSFLDEDRIDETTRIEVTYEYMPFGGQMKETLVGLRGEYDFSRNFSMGGTMLYNWSSTPQDIPQVGSTPESALVLNSDMSLRIPAGRFFPMPTSLSGEVAYSNQNPNTVGKAMIDNMEGIRQSYGVSTNPDSWQIAATPSLAEGTSQYPAHPEWLFKRLDEDEVYLRDVNPRVAREDDERRRVLLLDYRLPSEHPLESGIDPEASVVYVLSRTGADLSDKDSISMWVRGDGSGAELIMDLGTISEDADGTGILKTEDVNNSGTLDHGQDIGWDFEFGDEVIPIGARNARIDSNDLDRDGYLDTIENFARFEYDPADPDLRYLKMDWTGWRLITVPIELAGDEDIWSAVKHVRLTVRGRRGTSFAGRIGIMSIEALGNRWEVGEGIDNLEIRAINNYDSDEYIELKGHRDYERIYDKVGGSPGEREQALELEYSSLRAGATAYAYSRYVSAMDFSSHKEISLFLYGYEGRDADFGLWLGAGSGNNENYYFARIDASEIESRWNMYTFIFPDDFKEISGSPSVSNIMEIRAGVINNSGTDDISGRIWVNEVHMGEPDRRTGTALRGDLSSSIPGVIEFGGSYEKMERDFQTIVTPPRNQDRVEYSANARLTALSYLPVEGRFSRRSVTTPADRITPAQRNPYLREEDAGEVITDSLSLSARFSMRNLPALSASYSKSLSESNLTGKTDLTENYRGDISYNFPFTLPLFPRNIRGNIRKTDSLVEWREYQRVENPGGGKEDRLEETLAYSGSTELGLGRLLVLRPSFSRNEKYRTWDYYSGPLKGESPREPWSKSQDIGLSSQLNLLNWFRPSGQMSARIIENYNFVSTNSVSVPADTKDISRNFTGSVSAGVPARNLLPFVRAADTLNINTSYSAEKGDSWHEVDRGYTVFDKLNPYYELRPSTDTEKTPETLTSRSSIRHTVNWSPFAHLGLDKGLMNLMGGVSVRGVYNFTESRRDVRGTVLETETRYWPDLELNHGSVERLPFSGGAIRDIRLRTRYRHKEESSFSDADPVDLTVEKRYGANCRFLFLKDYDTLVEYSRDTSKKDNLREDSYTLEESVSYSGQVRVPLKRNWNLIARYSQSETERISSLSDTPLADRRTYRPGLSFDALLELPPMMNIPFLGSEVATMGRMRVRGTLDAEFSRSSLDVERTNYDKYMLSGSSEMDVSSNMRMTLGLGGQYLHNRVLSENSYISFYMSTDLVIMF